jgi:hypothetical protein
MIFDLTTLVRAVQIWAYGSKFMQSDMSDLNMSEFYEIHPEFILHFVQV